MSVFEILAYNFIVFCGGFLVATILYLLDTKSFLKKIDKSYKEIQEKSRIDQRHLFEKYKKGLQDYHNYREKYETSSFGLPKTISLGDIRYLEIFEEYDGPRLFSCVNTCGEVFLAISVEDDVKNSKERWLYSKVSIDRLKQIKTGEIDLYQAFKEAEPGFVVQIIIEPGKCEEARIPNEHLSVSDLPLPGEKLFDELDITIDNFISDKTVNGNLN